MKGPPQLDLGEPAGAGACQLRLEVAMKTSTNNFRFAPRARDDSSTSDGHFRMKLEYLMKNEVIFLAPKTTYLEMVDIFRFERVRT